ncbi:uncharacterized protein I206_100589 [Kwoniella pini CBS 10737]|uniref:BTB domain-containing protein n=1 Tax=Kwoniella pini CBS 10737 TaxID=1296096 RepID=A0A1B9ID61_9TREE|nr:uncharacterized protein I206_00736 [Kwoniella pini CBS 10737]OCF53433.1 hypothetical protein I206_00736 [Kwoniella pini CBS 10737]
MSDEQSEDDFQEIGVDLDISSHPVYNDPNDKIVIISNDYIKFRASKFHLMRTSQFFDGLLSTVESEEPTKEEPIHLDFPSSTISLFLDLSTCSNPSIPTINSEEAKTLLDFLEYAICDDLIDIGRSSLRNSLENQPFELLVTASRRNDLEMAKHALRKIDNKVYNEYFKSAFTEVEVKQYLRRLTRPYHLALVDAAMTTIEGSFGFQLPHLTFIDDWSTFADSFHPDQFT